MRSGLLQKAKSVIFYAGVRREEFLSVMPHIKQKIRKENISNLNLFAILSFALFFSVFLMSVLFLDDRYPEWLYGSMALVSAIVWGLNRLVRDREGTAIPRILVYSFIFALFTFAVVLGTLYSPKEYAVSFFVLLIAVPLVFVDFPAFFCVLSFLSSISFLVMGSIFKEPEFFSNDLLNTVIFYLVSLVACVYTMNVKLQRLMLEYQYRVISETDVLTGVWNRNAFDTRFFRSEFPAGESHYFVYLDANGLHEMNDENGHAAGDEMLCGVASVMQNQFGENVFRIGGDEFVTFGSDVSKETIDRRLENMRLALTGKGYSVSVGVAFCGNPVSQKELMRNAEVNMYAEKAAYYRTTGKDRRRH